MKFPVKFSKNDPLTHLRWLLSHTCIHRVPKIVFTEPMKKSFEKLNNKTFRSHSSVFIFKKCDISSQTHQKQPSQTPAMVIFRGTYALTSKRSTSTEPKTRPFQWINNEIFWSHSSVFIFKKTWYFQSHSVKTTLSHTSGGSFQRHVSTDFKNVFFYWG